MPVVKVKNLSNEEVGDLELSDAVFGVPLNKALIYSAVKSYLANQRAGTSATKTRGDVRDRARSSGSRKGRPRAHSQPAVAPVERRRKCSRAAAARLVLPHTEEDAARRDPVRVV